MPFSGGNYSLYATGNPTVPGTTISSAWANNTLNDIATGLSTCLLKDGSQTVTANIPMSGFKFTGLAAGTTNGDSVRYEQVIGAFLPIGGGTLTGNLFFTDATYDIGASGATRPRHLFLSNNLTMGGNAVISGTIQVTGHTTFEGVTSTGATGSGLLVFGTSPTLTTAVLGSSTATTQSAGDNSTKVATTAYADTAGGGTLATPTATTSGTSIDYSGIPSTVKEVHVMFVGVSTNGTSPLAIRIGPSGGVVSSGYLGGSGGATSAGAGAAAASTTGFRVGGNPAATNVWSGIITLRLENSSNNTWTASGSIFDSTNTNFYGTSGRISLSGALSKLSLTTDGGSDTFDAGEINLQYK